MTGALPGRRPRLPVVTAIVGALALLALVLQLAPDAEALRCSREALRRGELWRLLTGSLLHADLGHAIRDLTPLAVIGALYERRIGPRFHLALLLATAAAPLAALASAPGLAGYCGLSGAVHGLWAAAVVFEWGRAGWRPPRWLALLTGGLVLKLGIESAIGAPLLALELPPGFHPAPACHLAGAACGAAAMLWPRTRASRQEDWVQPQPRA